MIRKEIKKKGLVKNVRKLKTKEDWQNNNSTENKPNKFIIYTIKKWYSIQRLEKLSICLSNSG